MGGQYGAVAQLHISGTASGGSVGGAVAAFQLSSAMLRCGPAQKYARAPDQSVSKRRDLAWAGVLSMLLLWFPWLFTILGCK